MPAVKSIPFGTVFGRWTVICLSNKKCGNNAAFDCVCSCGNLGTVKGSALRSGKSQSCGCLSRDRIVQASTKHGHAGRGVTRTLTYKTWVSMKLRCDNPACKSYPKYGGRGIIVCDRWSNSFDAFLEDMGPKPGNLSIDRINNDGNYEPGNCRWATAKEQSRNNRWNRKIEFQGKSLCIAEWSEITGIPQGTISDRIRGGWATEKMLTMPISRTWAKDMKSWNPS